MVNIYDNHIVIFNNMVHTHIPMSRQISSGMILSGGLYLRDFVRGLLPGDYARGDLVPGDYVQDLIL